VPECLSYEHGGGLKIMRHVNDMPHNLEGGTPPLVSMGGTCGPLPVADTQYQ